MLTNETPPIPVAEDVVRSVFELGGNRLSIFEVDGVLDIARSILTKGSNPVQEESISSSSSSHPSSSTSFWFLLSSTGSIDYVSDSSLPLLGYRPNELRHKSAFSIVAIRDHHILPPILNVGPNTSMSCRLHLLKESQEAPFDVTFAKLSTRQLNSDVEKERSATLCVARAIAVSHGKIVLQLDSCSRVIDVENRSELPINTSLLLSRHVSELVAKSDATVLDTLLEAHSECSAQLSLQLAGITAGAMVRSVHQDGGVVILHCEMNKLENSLPTADSNSDHGVTVVSNNDRLSEICSSVFSEDVAHPTGSLTLYCSSPSLPPVLQPMVQLPSAPKPKKTRKTKAKKPKLLERDSCLKRLLASRAPDLLPESASIGDYSYIDMYSASTMSGAAHYMNPNGVNPMAYQQNVSTSSYGMPMGGADAAQAYAMHQQHQAQQQHPMQHWNPADYYQQQQQHQAFAQQQQQAQQVQQQKGVKRKPTNNSDRPNKMPYSHQTPQFAFSQATPAGHLDPTTMSSMPTADDYRLQQPQLNGHLSPYRYSPGSTGSPYWPAGGRPPSRSEIVRMELRNSLQAKQVANQQRQPIPMDVPAAISSDSSSQSSSAPGIGADSLGFDLDIVLKDSDGSLMDAELDTVFDWKLVGGCGFDMDNESTKCLVMQLLS